MVATRAAEPASYSRNRILDAAVRCLVERGYSAASTVEIQNMAGVSRGRLLHYFPSKDALLVAAAQYLAAGRVQETAEHSQIAIRAAEGSPERIDEAVDLMWSTYQQPYFWAATELWVASRHDEGLRAALLPAERDLYAAVRDVVDSMFGEVLAARSRYPVLRELLLTSMRGVALTYSFDPRCAEDDYHVRQWKDAAHALLAG
jgi:AcrR family transcriptional regulator